MEHTTNTFRSVRRCAGGAIALTVLAGVVTLPAVSASAAPGAHVAAASVRDDRTAADATKSTTEDASDVVAEDASDSTTEDAATEGTGTEDAGAEGAATEGTGTEGAGTEGAATTAGREAADTSQGASSSEVAAEYAPVVVTSDLTYLDNDKLRISGTATPGVVVTLSANDALGRIFDVGVADAETGRFSFEPGRNISMADKRAPLDVTLKQEGDEEVTVQLRSLQQDLEFQSARITSALTYAPNSPTYITGTATPYAAIHMSIRTPGEDAFVRADADGYWEFTTRLISATDDTITITQRFEREEATEFTFTRQGEVAPITVATTSFVKGQRGLVEGTASPNARINLFSGTTFRTHVTADDDGKWSYQTGSPILTDTFTRTVKSPGADDVTFRLTAAGSEQTAPITVTTTSFTKGQKQLIEGTAAPGARVNVHAGAKYLMHVVANGDGKWSYTTGSAITGDTFTRTLKSEGTEDVTFTLTAK